MFAHFDKECVEELLVTEFVVGVLLDILGIFIFNDFEGFSIRAVDIGEFRVLLPEIRFEDFCRGQESQDSGIALRDRSRFIGWPSDRPRPR